MLRTRDRSRGGSSGGGSAIPLRVVVVAERGYNQRSNSAPNNAFAFRIPKIVCTPCSSFTVSNSNFYMDATFSSQLGREADTGNDYTISEMSLEAPNGTVVPITSLGGRAITIANGDVDIQMDSISPSAFGYSEFPVGTYWLKGKGTVPSAGNFIPTNSQASLATGGQQVFFNTASTTTSSTDASGVYTATGTAFTSVFVSLLPLLLGVPASDGKSFITIGDSIAQGVAESGASGQLPGRGFINRGFYNGGTNSIPSLNYGAASARTSLFTGGTKWRSFLKYAKYAIDELNTNSVDGGFSLATIQSQSTDLWDIIKAGGVTRIYKTELLCKTTSTDGYATAGNQTPVSGWDSGQIADQVNQWMATQVGTGIWRYITLPAAKDGGNPFVWASPGITTDGLHPTTNGHIAIATSFRTGIDLDPS